MAFNYGGGNSYAQPQQSYGAPPSAYGQQPSQYGQQGGYYSAAPPPAQPGYGASPGGYQGPGGYQQQAQGGYGQNQSYGGPPPPQGQYQQQGDQQLRTWFASVDVDRSGSITEQELANALVNGDWSPFSQETIKMLMNLFDVDRSGTIGFNEFAGLWKYIKDWQGVFRNFDADRSGTIESRELANALSQFGYNLPPHIINSLEKKYNASYVVHPGQLAGNRPTGINFDAFVRCCVTVRQLSESFKRADQDGDGWVNMSYTQFMEMVIAAP